MNDYQKIADLLFPNIDKTPDYYEKMYPERKTQGLVTRFAPSPTGYVHMGSLLTSFYNYILAKKTNGVFFLRIEDTDIERTVENGVTGIINDLKSFDIIPDEGVNIDLESYGDYGPYIQTQRQEIYLTYAKDLVSKGLAYPCFCSKDEIEAIRHEQEEKKEEQIGYYGKYAKCRNLTYDEVKANIDAGKKFALRLKSTAKIGDRVKFKDRIRGEIEMQDCINDVVILKSETLLPPYNLAHAIDDHLMHTSIVIRSNEWLNAVPEHKRIFDALGFKQPEYSHVAFVQRFDQETGMKRKISKRKDPETAVSAMVMSGYPTEAVWEYLYTLGNTNFEEWRIANPKADLSEFDFSLDKISLSGALFDVDKFNDVSKNVISKMTAEKVYDLTLEWAKKYNAEWAVTLEENHDYAVKMFAIDRYNEKPRKDIVKLSDVESLYSYFFDKYFVDVHYETDETFGDDLKAIFDDFLASFDMKDDKTTWFEKIKEIGVKHGYASAVKDYKKEPEKYKGHCGTVCNYIRVALTGRKNSPDLYEICKLFGKEKMKERLDKFVKDYGDNRDK